MQILSDYSVGNSVVLNKEVIVGVIDGFLSWVVCTSKEEFFGEGVVGRYPGGGDGQSFIEFWAPSIEFHVWCAEPGWWVWVFFSTVFFVNSVAYGYIFVYSIDILFLIYFQNGWIVPYVLGIARIDYITCF